jgi:hypothetical protein
VAFCWRYILTIAFQTREVNDFDDRASQLGVLLQCGTTEKCFDKIGQCLANFVPIDTKELAGFIFLYFYAEGRRFWCEEKTTKFA